MNLQNLNIPRPVETEPAPDIDWTCEIIARHLQKGLNDAYVPAKIQSLTRQKENQLIRFKEGLIGSNDTSYFDNQLFELQNNKIVPTAVNGIRAYDAFNVPLSEFPLLKVYRSSDVYSGGGIPSLSNLTVAYVLSLPRQEELQGSMRWVSTTIRRLLLNSITRIKLFIPEDGMRAEYRTTLNENLLPVYAFLRFYFSVKS